MSDKPCPACKGRRLKPESLAVTVANHNIAEVCELPVSTAVNFFDQLDLTEREQLIARGVLKEIHERLQFMIDVGLEYLTIQRAANTLSGGESQRIRLATQIGSKLMGVLYILDEPSIGLHPVSYTHLRAHETRHDLVCRLLLEKKKNHDLNS